MRLPIDTSAMQFLAVLPPRMETDYETKAPKTDKHGEVIWSVQVAAMAADSAEILKVTILGDPRVEAGTPVRMHGLVASPYTMGDRSGVSFRAEKIEPANGPARAKADA